MEISDQLDAAVAFTPGKVPWYPFDRTLRGIHSNCGWFLDGENFLNLLGFETPDRPTRGESLHRLRYHGYQ